MIGVLTLTEFSQFCLILEERIQTADLNLDLQVVTQLVRQGSKTDGLILICMKGSTDGCKEMRVLQKDRMLLVQIQSADKALTKLIQEMQGSAQECHMTPDGLAAGKSGNGLVYHSLEDGYGKIRLCRTLVDQRLDIRLCEYTAACGDGIYCIIGFCILIQTGGVRHQKGCHLVDKGACTAGTDRIHTLFDPAL